VPLWARGGCIYLASVPTIIPFMLLIFHPTCVPLWARGGCILVASSSIIHPPSSISFQMGCDLGVLAWQIVSTPIRL
ncbi:MAG: hypothetical protein ACKPKO_04210, partial [Candidatus Fonsibacter sp.]